MRAVVARNLEARGIDLHPRTNLTEVIQLIGILVNLLLLLLLSFHASVVTIGLLFVLVLMIFYFIF